MKLNISRAVIFFTLTVLSISFTPKANAAEKPTVAIMPLTLHAPADLAYLKDGIRAMLGSRLSAGAGVRVIGQAAIKEAITRAGNDAPVGVLAEELKAGLVLTGSITSLGQGISIDLKGIRPGSMDAEESFFASATDQSAIIGAVDSLVNDISARMYGKSSSATVSKPSGGVTVVSPVVAPVAISGVDKSAHPDRLFDDKTNRVPLSGGTVHQQGSTTKPLSQAPGFSGMVERSQYLKMEIQDFDTGDVFGDGTLQIVVADKNEVHVYSRNGSRLEKTVQFPSLPGYVKIISVNLADIDKDGRAEIYISANSENDALASAYEWDGTSFAAVFEKQTWHVKPMQIKDALVLLGQKGDFDTPYSPGVYKLQINNGKLEKGEKLNLPEDVNIFDFVMADFTGDGQLEVAAVDQDDDLTLYGLNDDKLWRGDGNFGYTVRFVGRASGTVSDVKKNYNVPSRLIAEDLNGDGRSELIVMRNPTGLTTMVKTITSYTGGSVEAKSWNGISLVNIWSTGKIGSYIAGYQLGKDAGSGENKLHVAVISKKSGKLLKTSKSIIVTYPTPDFTQ